MEAALLAVAIIGCVLIVWAQWAVRRDIADGKSRILGEVILRAKGTDAVLEEIQNALEEDSQLKARQPQPIKPSPSGPIRPRRFPTIASRRAQAEAASLSGTTHSAAVIENNTKAMEAR